MVKQVVLAISTLLAASATGGCATDGNTDYGRILTDVLGSQAGALSEAEVAAGLKEALTVGADRVVGQLSARNGYFGDDIIRIPLPKTLAKIQENLAVVGADGPLTNLQERINHAAESAAPRAKTLAVEAISSMTIDDAMGILNGGDTSATDFLKSRMSVSLAAELQPYMSQALDQSGAFTQLETTARAYVGDGMATQLRDDMITYAVDGALDGLFYYVAEEERAIRRDPVKRTTELLRRVFGG